MKLFGFFPYTMSVSSQSTYMTGNVKKVSIKNSKGWMIYSVVVIIAFLSLFAYDSYEAIVDPRGQVGGYATVKFLHLGYDIILNFAFASIVLLVFFTREKAKKIFKCRFLLRQGRYIEEQHVWKCKKTNSFVILNMVSVILTIVGFIIWVNAGLLTVQTTLLLSVRVTSDILMNMTFIIGLYIFLVESHLLLEEAFQHMPNDFSNNYKSFLKFNERTSLVAVIDENLPAIKKIKTYGDLLNKQTKDASTFWHSNVDLDEIQRRILCIFEFIRLLFDYYEKILLLLSIKMVMTFLLSLYYVSLWNLLFFAQKLISVALVSCSVAGVVYLNNIPMDLMEKVVSCGLQMNFTNHVQLPNMSPFHFIFR